MTNYNYSRHMHLQVRFDLPVVLCRAGMHAFHAGRQVGLSDYLVYKFKIIKTIQKHGNIIVD